MPKVAESVARFPLSIAVPSMILNLRGAPLWGVQESPSIRSNWPRSILAAEKKRQPPYNKDRRG